MTAESQKALGALTLAGVLLLGACASLPDFTGSADKTSTAIHPEIWPLGHSSATRDPAMEAKISALLAQMTVEEKVGQTVQGDIASIKPDDIRKYHLGSILDGGGSGPYGDDRALPPLWLKAADEFYAASIDTAPGRPVIPLIWGSDSVHGNSNIIGATIFPHNIGLGAAHDPDLIREIGRVTAIETRVVGADWTFAPTVAVVRDDRWGRTYEGYSEDPSIVTPYAGAIVEGIQGKPGDSDWLTGPHIIATAKHFLGDGGTKDGHDQGDNQSSEEELRDIFSPPYQAAIAAGVQVVMASYSSWRGEKMHGNRALLNDVLIDRFGLDGFVVGDWNGHGQVPGCTPTDCPASFNAGLDMFMAPDSWRGIYDNTLAEVKSGKISQARLDEAVSRILRVKFRAGVFDEGKPSARPYGGKWDELGSPEHRAVARQAVRESLVLLKNDGNILPLKPNLNILVAGDGADDMSKQTGGWTISWQGTGNTRTDFPHAQTVFEGIDEQVKAAGGTATLSVDGKFTQKPDVAIVVVGENPYAEFAGDRNNLAFEPGDPRDLRLIQSLRAKGIPVVSVFFSGRPLYVTREINASNAFVAAWLPGTEGGGIADLLLRKPDGSVDYDFHGKLSFSWPKAPDQTPLNVPRKSLLSFVSDLSYDPLFAFGYGMDYAHPHDQGLLPEAAGGDVAAENNDNYLQTGHTPLPWSLSFVNADGTAKSVDAPAVSPDGALSIARIDHNAQEDTLVATWSGSAAESLAISGSSADLSRQANGDMAVRVDLRVDEAPSGTATISMAGCGSKCGGAVDLTQALRAAHGAGWTSIAVRLSCFRKAGADMGSITMPFELTTAGRMVVSIGAVKLVPGDGPPSCPAAPQS
jgi:beta-glucosidase